MTFYNSSCSFPVTGDSHRFLALCTIHLFFVLANLSSQFSKKNIPIRPSCNLYASFHARHHSLHEPTPMPHLDLRMLFLPLLSLFFSLAASLFTNGNPLVLLSAPVVLLTLPTSCPNNSVQVPKQNSTALPTMPAVKAKLQPPINCV